MKASDWKKSEAPSCTIHEKEEIYQKQHKSYFSANQVIPCIEGTNFKKSISKANCPAPSFGCLREP